MAGRHAKRPRIRAVISLASPYRFRWDPPLEAVAALMRANWARPCWEYSASLLRYHVDKPSGGRRLSLGVESELSGALVGYQAHIPLDIELHGRHLRAVFASFLTAAAETRGAAIALATQVQLLERAQECGFEVYLTMCEVGALSNMSVKRACRAIARPLITLRVTRYFAGARPQVSARLTAPSPRTRQFEECDEAGVFELLQQSGASIPLRQQHRREDVAHRFTSADNRRTFVFERGGRIVGVIHVLVLVVLDRVREYRNAYIQDLALDDLTPDERKAFVNDVLHHVTALSIEAICVPDTGTFDAGLWKPLGFRMMPRAINLYGVPLRQERAAALANVAAFHLDVY